MKGYDDFKEELKQELAMRIDGMEEISVNPVRIFNQGEHEIVSINTRHDRRVLSHDCFLDSFFEQYQEGRTLAEIAEAVIDEYRNEEHRGIIRKINSFPLDRIKSLEDMREKLFFRMINTGKNKELLEEMPHFDYFDLSMVFYIRLGESENGMLSARITDTTLRRWGITKEHLREIALENTERMLPLRSMWIEDALLMALASMPVSHKELQDFKKEFGEQRGMPVMFVSNESGLYGFGAVFYSGFLKKAAEVFQDDLYILPCSVHEGLVCPAEMACEAGELSALVKHVNETELAPDEYLSDHVYYYDRNTDKIQMITEQGE